VFELSGLRLNPSSLLNTIKYLKYLLKRLSLLGHFNPSLFGLVIDPQLLEQKLLATVPEDSKPKLWQRYVDDNLMFQPNESIHRDAGI